MDTIRSKCCFVFEGLYVLKSRERLETLNK